MAHYHQMAQRKGLKDYAHMAREECALALEDLKEQRAGIARHLKKLNDETDSRKCKPGLIGQLVTAQAICLDKQHHLLMRLRDLESFGTEESTEYGAIIIQRNDDGTTCLVGEPPEWAELVAQTGRGTHSDDS